MIVFSLRCSRSHIFEAWFRDGAGYERQAAAGEISCPVCGDNAVAKAPMAPNIASRRDSEPPARESPEARARGEMLKRLRALRSEVEKNSEHVGARFPEEARKIHHGEAERRSIHGDADRKEAEALREEGIDVRAIPWVPRADG